MYLSSLLSLNVAQSIQRNSLLLLVSHYVVSDSFMTLQTIACQAPRSIEFSRYEYWSGLPFLYPRHLPDPRIEPTSSTLQTDSSSLSHEGNPIVYPTMVLKYQQLSPLTLFAIPRTIGHQAPLCMGFSRQEYWSRQLFSSPGDLPNPGIEPPAPALAGGFFTTEPPGKPQGILY